MNGRCVFMNKKSGGRNTNATAVDQFDLDGNYIKTWDCIMTAARAVGASPACISLCCRGKKYYSAGGYRWKYAKKQKEFLYLAVTNDKYELPIAVADSASELAKMLGLSVYTIYTGVCREAKNVRKIVKAEV